MEEKHNINEYNRTVQTRQLPAPLMAPLREVLQAGLSQSVSLCLNYHTKEEELEHSVPD